VMSAYFSEIRSSVVLGLLAVVVAGAAFNGVRLKYFNLVREGNGVAITWETDHEDQVQVFEVFRKSGFGAEFVRIGEHDGLGPGQQYKLIDDQVYKNGSSGSAFIDYRLEVVYSDGVRQRLAEKKIDYTSTAIRRSWGSIKAMFQD